MISEYETLEVEAQEPANRPSDPDRLGLLDLLIILAARKKTIFAVAAAGALVSAAIAFALPKSYAATAVIMPPQQQRSTASVILGQLGAVSGLAGGMGQEMLKSQSDVYVGLLGSRTIADNLIGQFKLQQVYDAKFQSLARETLAAKTHFQTSKDTLIRIVVEDAEPQRAAALANGYIDELFKQNGRLALMEAEQRRKFFELELESERRATADSEAALRKMQEASGLLEVTNQVGGALRAVMEVRAQISGREVMLERLKAGATDQNPEVVLLKSELAALREQGRKLESSTGRDGSGAQVLSTGKIPGTSLEYMRLFRDVKFHETLMELIAREYEAARLDQSKEAPVIQVVDLAVPPDIKTWPPRALLTLAGAILFGLSACLWVFLRWRLSGGREAERLAILLGTLSNGHVGVRP